MIPFEKLGLASSVAKPWNFSWDKTLEFASQSEFKQVQLFLNVENLQSSTVDFLKKAQLKFTIHLHLPPSLNSEKIGEFLQSLDKSLLSSIYLIQHQPYWEDLEQVLKTVSSVNFVPGIENDQPEQGPLDFLNWFLILKTKMPEVLPVIDVPRFFHQAAQQANFEGIASQVLTLVRQLQQMKQPFILHAIDHPADKSDRPNWQPLLEGTLPWNKILGLVNLHPDLLKCLMFEYENWNMVQDSIQNLKKS